MMLYDGLRPPSPLDPSAAGYKEWLHVNVLHHESGIVGLINVSLHGPPMNPRSRALGTALFHVPAVGWVGNIEVGGLEEAAVGPASIRMQRVALAVDALAGEVMASVLDRANGVVVRSRATPAAAPVPVEWSLPLGHGWISWYVVPRLTLKGAWTVADRRMDLEAASAYYDHNWGRWHWGDDLGWEWGCFLTPAPGPGFVMSRVTDRAHRVLGAPSLLVTAGGRRWMFDGPAVELDYRDALEVTPRRVPGAMAALHQDRAHPPLPRRLRIDANNGIDRIAVEFSGQAAAQVVAADPIVRGYGFIHEIAGQFTCSGRLGGADVAGAGLGMLEHVD